MYGKFLFRKQIPDFSLEARHLKAEIDLARLSMESARNHFEQEADPTLIDCHIFELNAAQLRYQFLLRRYKHLEKLTEAAACDTHSKPRCRPGFVSQISCLIS